MGQGDSPASELVGHEAQMSGSPTAHEIGEEEGDPLVERPYVGVQARVEEKRAPVNMAVRRSPRPGRVQGAA